MHLFLKTGTIRTLACTLAAAALMASASYTAEAAAAKVRRDVAAENYAKKQAEAGLTSPVTAPPVLPAAPQQTDAVPVQAPATVTEPVVSEPAVSQPVVETHAVETPIIAQPAVETPAVEIPAVETPAVAAPVVAAPEDEDTPEVSVIVEGDSSKGQTTTNTNRNIQATQAALPGTNYIIRGTCTTEFSTSTQNRKTNIAVASSKIDKLILMPGQEISVSTVFTPRTSANGYKSAGVYSGGKTVSGIGGGICQVSSTVYVAAMNAGLTVTQRHAHSMPVAYLPIGMDAAISEGSKDLRIRNDYAFPVMFEAFTYGDNLTVNVYTDGSLTAGTTYRLHSVKKSSLKADTYLEISNNGVVVEDRFIGSSSYMPHK